MIRRLILTACMGAALGAATACGDTDGPAAQATQTVIDTLIPAGANPAPRRRYAQLEQAGAPALQIAVVAVNAAPVMRRDSQRDGVATWLSPAGESVALQDGFLRGTRGLGMDVLATDIAQSRAAVLEDRPGPTRRRHTFLTGNDQAETVTYACQVSRFDTLVIDVAGQPTATRVMREVCEGQQDSFQNIFWVRTADNTVVQSSQWASPETGMISMRPVGG